MCPIIFWLCIADGALKSLVLTLLLHKAIFSCNSLFVVTCDIYTQTHLTIFNSHPTTYV